MEKFEVIMKRNYINPVSEIVRLKIMDSILNDQPVYLGSRGADPGDSFGKQNDLFDDSDFNGDIWGDAGDTGNPYDIWGE